MRPSAAIAIQTGALHGENLPKKKKEKYHDRHIIQTRTNTTKTETALARQRERESAGAHSGWAVIRQFHMNNLAGNAA